MKASTAVVSLNPLVAFEHKRYDHDFPRVLFYFCSAIQLALWYGLNYFYFFVELNYSVLGFNPDRVLNCCVYV